MLKLKKHHYAVLILTIAFILAWAIWTFIMLPAAETPNLPAPPAIPPP